MMPGVEEEDEDEVYEEVDQFGPDLRVVVDAFNSRLHDDGTTDPGDITAPASPMSPMMEGEIDPLGGGASSAVSDAAGGKNGGGVPLTAEALAQMEEENDAKEAEEVRKEKELEKGGG
jgi:hypothetical protein